MYAVIITSHNKLAEGLNTALQLVTGEMNNLRVVNYLENQTYEDLDKALKEAYDELIDLGYQKVIFIADLLGGTPFSRSVINFSENENVRILSGLNFPLCYTALTLEESSNMDNDIEMIIENGKNGITVYKNIEKEDDNDINDGI